MPKCSCSNQQKLRKQANEKDKTTDRSENKRRSTFSAKKQTTGQLCFIEQETIKVVIMWSSKVVMSKHS